MQLVVDANVLLAAFLKGAKTRELFFDERLSFLAPEHLIKEDAPYLAVALLYHTSIWSNDKGIKNQSLVRVYSTREIIVILN